MLSLFKILITPIKKFLTFSGFLIFFILFSISLNCLGLFFNISCINSFLELLSLVNFISSGDLVLPAIGKFCVFFSFTFWYSIGFKSGSMPFGILLLLELDIWKRILFGSDWKLLYSDFIFLIFSWSVIPIDFNLLSSILPFESVIEFFISFTEIFSSWFLSTFY